MTQTTDLKTANAEAEQNRQQTEQKAKKRKSPMHYPQLFLFHALVVILVVWLLFGVFFGVTTAPNDDMSPRIDGGDMLLYYRLDRDVQAQDVVVLNKNDTTYVSRVVAVGGDTVDITDNQSLVINGNHVVEDKIFYKTAKYHDYMSYPITLAEGECFVLDDKRQSGEDSRYFGTVKESEILGTVITVLRKNNL